MCMEYNNHAITTDGFYVDGISITHGHSTRKHIWTFAAALHEVTMPYPQALCPCTNIHNHITIPMLPVHTNLPIDFYPDDPLWGGQGCGPFNSCCSFNCLPWFMKQLPASTHDNIEMRLCANEPPPNEDIFETLEFYICTTANTRLHF